MSILDDIIFVAMEDWDEVWRRNQPIAAEFARRVPSRKLIYMGLPIDISHGFRKLSLKPIWRALFNRKPRHPNGFPNIYLFNPLKWLPNSLPFCQRINRWLERLQLRHTALRIGLKRPILWMNPHYTLHLVGRMDESLVVYDIGDDWSQLKQAEWLRSQTITEDAELCRKADVLIVVSEHLQKLKEQFSREVNMIPNGVYLDRYQGIATKSIPSHPSTKAWRHPILAYTGTIHEERVDLPLVEEIARAFPNATVALIGPCLLNEAAISRLKAHPNLEIAGPFPFEEMPSVMSGIDVCIVPHVVSPFTESLSPLKLYEYLASGLPAVSTSVPGFREHSELFSIAQNTMEMIEGIQKALREPRNLRIRRQSEAKKHSWNSRMDAIEAAIENAKDKRICQSRLSSASSLSAITPAASH